MPDHHNLGSMDQDEFRNIIDQCPFSVGIDQPDIVPVIQQRPADAEQTQRRQVVAGNPTADRSVRWV
jgi:hypothetical protein